MSGADNILHGDSAADYLMPKISLRDYFAGQALITVPNIGLGGEQRRPQDIVSDAYHIADLMLAKRAKASS